MKKQVKTWTLIVLTTASVNAQKITLDSYAKKQALLLEHQNVGVKLCAEHQLEIRASKNYQLLVGLFKNKNNSSLIAALQSNNFWLQKQALRIAREEKKQKTIPAIAKLLNHPDNTMRRTAVWTLYKIGRGLEPALPHLLESLHDQDRFVRRYSARLIEKMEIRAITAYPSLIRALHKNDPVVKEHIVNTLAKLGTRANVALPALVKILQHQDSSLVLCAMHAINKIGTYNKEELATVTQAAKKYDGPIRKAAGEILIKNGKEALPHLLPLLKSNDWDIKEYAIITLGEIGAEAKNAIPYLQELSQSILNKKYYGMKECSVYQAVEKTLLQIKS